MKDDTRQTSLGKSWKRQAHSLNIRKDAHKFSAAHMTVFSESSKEALHGHNYVADVAIGLSDHSFEAWVPYSVIKGMIKKICDSWDEKVLVAEKCKFFKIKKQSAQEVEFLLCGKRYVLPADEIVFLPIDNVTSEALAETFCNQLLKALVKKDLEPLIQSVQVRIEESTGQGATFLISRL